MNRKQHTKADPIEQEIELALNPGAFIHDRGIFPFVGGLEVPSCPCGSPVARAGDADNRRKEEQVLRRRAGADSGRETSDE